MNSFIPTFFLYFPASPLLVVWLMQFLSHVKKIVRQREYLIPLIDNGILTVLLLSILRKEYMKKATRVLIAEVINEMNSSTPSEEFAIYLSSRMPSRLFHRLFAPETVHTSVEVIDTLESISFSPDLLWTNLMRIELIKSLQEELTSILTND